MFIEASQTEVQKLCDQRDGPQIHLLSQNLALSIHVITLSVIIKRLSEIFLG